MEAVIAIAAAILVGIQAHRNYLMIQAAKKPTTVVSDVKVELGEEYWPTVTVSNDITIDYDALAEALSRQEPHIIYVKSEPVIIPNPVPYHPPSPYWQTPVVSGDHTNIVGEDTNLIDINGVPAKRFPNK